MGTRSLIGEPAADGWRARYCHWDGYPSGVGQAIWELVRTDGLATVTRTLLHDHRGWSSLGSDEMPDHYDSTRFESVQGYGIAYTPAEHPDEWITPGSDTWGAEWVYIMTPDGLAVGILDCEGGVSWVQVVSWLAPWLAPDWDAICDAGGRANAAAWAVTMAAADVREAVTA